MNVEFLIFQGRIEAVHAKYIPVSVYILRRSDSAAGFCTISRTVADSILRGIEHEMRDHTPLSLGIVRIEKSADIMRERGF